MTTHHLAVIGLGLIGGSIAKAAFEQGIKVTAFDVDPDALKAGEDLNIIHQGFADIPSAVQGADLVLLAVPVLAMEDAIRGLVDVLIANPNLVLTDVGSVKQPLLDAFNQVLGAVPDCYVPGHPIAGSEKHGVKAADATLFQNHKVLLCPLENTSDAAVGKVTAFWEMAGADVSELSIEDHDRILAQTSHLPHLLAFALIDALSDRGDSLQIFDYAAGGLRDFSRIAASDPTMWRDIFKSNREALLGTLDEYLGELADLKRLMESDDWDGVFALLSRSKAARDHFSKLLEERDQK